MASDVASEMPTSNVARMPHCCGRLSQMCCSAMTAIVAIVSTDSTGYLPAAVSLLNITASVPSTMALYTSLASARVGRGELTIELNICVAVMTGLLATLQS